MEANAGQGAPVVGQPGDTVDTDTEVKQDVSEDTPQEYFLAVIPGAGALGSVQVIAAEDEQDAANRFALANGIEANTFPNDTDGNDVTPVSVVKLNSLTIDHNKVSELANPKD